MDRRQFVKSSIAASVAATFPFAAGCGREQPELATDAENGVAAVTLDRAEIELERAAVREFGEALQGPVLLAGDEGYDTARMIWNGMHDKHPALIARCMSADDVANAVTFARERNLLTAVRGGGHSWPGKSVCEGGLMIDLAPMNTVDADPGTRRARAKGGALLYNLDSAARQHELITTAGVVSHTGLGGYTLGGGFGRLNRKFGLTIDNLESAEIVTADGRIRRISEDDEPDLFWAIRGGGGNFGVVTGFEYALHPMAHEILCGNIVWPVDQAAEVLHFWADWHAGLPDELYVGPTLMTTPDGAQVLAMEVLYVGDPAAGEKEVAPLAKRGTPIANTVGLNDYLALQTSMDGMTAHGIRSYARNGMAGEITRELTDAMVESFLADPRVVLTSHTAGGAVSRVDELATAFPHRNAESMLVYVGFWADPALDDELIASTRAMSDALEPFMGGYYDNIDYDDDDSGAANYGPAYDRLSRIKAEYDPNNLFRLNSNIEPA